MPHLITLTAQIDQQRSYKNYHNRVSIHGYKVEMAISMDVYLYRIVIFYITIVLYTIYIYTYIYIYILYYFLFYIYLFYSILYRIYLLLFRIRIRNGLSFIKEES